MKNCFKTNWLGWYYNVLQLSCLVIRTWSSRSSLLCLSKKILWIKVKWNKTKHKSKYRSLSQSLGWYLRSFCRKICNIIVNHCFGVRSCLTTNVCLHSSVWCCWISSRWILTFLPVSDSVTLWDLLTCLYWHMRVPMQIWRIKSCESFVLLLKWFQNCIVLTRNSHIIWVMQSLLLWSDIRDLWIWETSPLYESSSYKLFQVNIKTFYFKNKMTSRISKFRSSLWNIVLHCFRFCHFILA